MTALFALEGEYEKNMYIIFFFFSFKNNRFMLVGYIVMGHFGFVMLSKAREQTILISFRYTILHMYYKH